MQLSSRGPSGPGTARGSSRGKTIRDAVATACQRDAPARLADRHRTPPLPRYQPRSGATPMARRAAARAVLGLDIRQGDRSGRTSAVVSASARHAFGVGATTRSPCLLHGLLPASPHGPRELRHARRPHTVEERDSTDIPARGSGAGVWRALGQTLACRPQQVRSGPVLGRSHLGVSRPRARCRVLAGSRGYPAARRALLLANLRTGPLSPPDTSFAISTPTRCVRTDAAELRSRTGPARPGSGAGVSIRAICASRSADQTSQTPASAACGNRHALSDKPFHIGSCSWVPAVVGTRFRTRW
jgi:hypothetical protein